MKLFVDDVRDPPDDGWIVARTVADAKTYLLRDDVIMVSLDHDMGACADCVRRGAHIGDCGSEERMYQNWCQHAEDGYQLVCWMIEHDRIPTMVNVHSMNPVGRRRMIQALESRDRAKAHREKA